MAALELKFYDKDAEVIATHIVGFIPWKMLKKALALSKIVNKKTQEDAFDEALDDVSAFVCDLFQNKFSLAELEEHAEVSDVMGCFRSVVKQANIWGNA